MVDIDTIAWIEQKIAEICQKNGYGHISVTWYLKCGELDGIEKSAIETEKKVLHK